MKKKYLSKELTRQNRNLLSLNLLHATLERTYEMSQFTTEEVHFLSNQASSSDYQTKVFATYAYYKPLSRMPIGDENKK